MEYSSNAEFYVFKNRVFYSCGWQSGCPKELAIEFMKKVIAEGPGSFRPKEVAFYKELLELAESSDAKTFRKWEGRAGVYDQFVELKLFAAHLGYSTRDGNGRLHFYKKVLASKPFNSLAQTAPDKVRYVMHHISVEKLVSMYNTPPWHDLKLSKGVTKEDEAGFDRAYFKLHLKRNKESSFVVSDSNIFVQK